MSYNVWVKNACDEKLAEFTKKVAISLIPIKTFWIFFLWKISQIVFLFHWSLAFGSILFFAIAIAVAYFYQPQLLKKNQCYILIPRKCPRKTPFKTQCPPPPPLGLRRSIRAVHGWQLWLKGADRWMAAQAEWEMSSAAATAVFFYFFLSGSI